MVDLPPIITNDFDKITLFFRHVSGDVEGTACYDLRLSTSSSSRLAASTRVLIYMEDTRLNVSHRFIDASPA